MTINKEERKELEENGCYIPDGRLDYEDAVRIALRIDNGEPDYNIDYSYEDKRIVSFLRNNGFDFNTSPEPFTLKQMIGIANKYYKHFLEV